MAQTRGSDERPARGQDEQPRRNEQPRSEGAREQPKPRTQEQRRESVGDAPGGTQRGQEQGFASAEGVPTGDQAPPGGSGIVAGGGHESTEFTGRNLSGVGAQRLGKTPMYMYNGPERRRRQEDRDHWMTNDRRRHAFTYGDRHTF